MYQHVGRCDGSRISYPLSERDTKMNCCRNRIIGYLVNGQRQLYTRRQFIISAGITRSKKPSSWKLARRIKTYVVIVLLICSFVLNIFLNSC